jgi:hypothetical protein
VKKLPLLSYLISLLIPGSVVLGQPYPSFMLDSTIRRVPPPASIGHTRVAFGPEVGLATWTVEGRLVGARIDRAGTLLDTVPIDVPGPYSGGRPDVVWGCGYFLVAWMEARTPSDITACALIDTNGRVVWRRVVSPMRQGIDIAVAFDGTNFLAAWIARSEADSLAAYFSRVTPTGVVLDSPPKRVAQRAPIEQYDIDVCYHGGRYLAVWDHWNTGGLWASWILPDGTVPDSVGFPIHPGVPVDFPTVTHDRQNFIVGWYEHHYKTKLARVTDNGEVLDTAGIVVDTNSHWENDVCSTGDTTLVVYFTDSLWKGDSLTPVAARVDTALQRLGAPVALAWPSEGNVYGNGPSALSAATAGDSFIVTWAQPAQDISVQGTCLAWFRRLDQQGQLLDTAPVPMSFGPNPQRLPDVATDGTDFLAVWVDLHYDSANLTRPLVGRRFSADGALLDSQPFRIGGINAWEPAQAFGGGCYLATWYEDHGLSAARISAAGMLLDSVPTRIVDPAGQWPGPDVAYGDSVFLVVWATSGLSQVHGVRMTPDGVVLDSTPLLLQADSLTGPNYPQVAFDGTNFLVARRDRLPTDQFQCARVSPAGQLLDSADITIGTATDDAYPDLAFGGGVYGAADNRRSYFWRVSPDGSALGFVPHSYQGATRVVYDGTDFMLLTEMRDSSSYLTNKLGALRITPDGQVLDDKPFALLTADSATVGVDNAAMAANGAGRVAVVTESYEPEPYGAYRIRAATFPAIVGVNSQRDAAQPVAFRVSPNPASRIASLSFNLTQAGPVQVSAFDVTGRRCASLFSGRMKAGRQTLPLDTHRLANGVYFLRLEAGTTRHSTRLVVAR